MVILIRSLISYVWVLVSLLWFAPIAALCLPWPRVHDWFTVAWAGVTLKIGGARMRVLGIENVARTERYVVVANHQSILDIPMLMVALGPRASVRFMAKRAIFWVPVLGWAMWAFGHVAVDRSSARRTLPGLRKAQERLKRFSFLFFPEGTRTETGRMGPFKSAAFKIAARAGVRVLPVTISGALEALPKWKIIIEPENLVTIRVHAPIAPRGDAASDVQALERACFQVIQGGLPEHQRGGDEPERAAGA